MNVLILTPDRVGSTLLQRLVTIYMLRKGFDKPVINLHELTNGLEKYYNTTLNQEVLGKPRGTEWGYYQSLAEVQSLIESVDHYNTSRLAHYHIKKRKDTIQEQIKFYEFLNENFYIISCRRNNIFEHALSWIINAHSKVLNVYSAIQKINAFQNLYNTGINVDKDALIKHLNNYKNYISWSNDYFNIQSYFQYDKDITNIENYILNLEFMQGHQSNTWLDMFEQDFDSYNFCHRLLPNLKLLEKHNEDCQIDCFTNVISFKEYDLMKGTDWPDSIDQVGTTNLPLEIKEEIDRFMGKMTFKVSKKEYNYLQDNLNRYLQINQKLTKLVDDGYLVTSVPLKLQSLKEKANIIKNLDQCLEWYNEWAITNNLGDCYTSEDLNQLMEKEEKSLTQPMEKYFLLN